MLQRSSPVLGLDDLIPICCQAGSQKAADCRLVVDNENFQRSGVADHAAISVVAARSAATGKLIVNTAPDRSARLPATIMPPMASTKPRQIASPRPVPAR